MSLCLWPSPLKPDTYESIVSRARTPILRLPPPSTPPKSREIAYTFSRMQCLPADQPVKSEQTDIVSSGWFLTDVCGSLGGARTTLDTKCLTPSSILGTSGCPSSPLPGSHPHARGLRHCLDLRMSLILQFGTRVLGACRQRQPTCPAFFACNALHMCPGAGRHLEEDCIILPWRLARVARRIRFPLPHHGRHPEARPREPCSITTGSLAMVSDNGLRKGFHVV